MSAPQFIDALVEGDDQTCRAKQIPHDLEGVYNSTLYEDANGRRFFVDNYYLSECVKNHTHVNIPLQVITQRETMLEKLEYGQMILNRQNKEKKTGLILPDDGIKV